MKPLFTLEEYEAARFKSTLPLECYQCGKSFLKLKRYIYMNYHPTKYNDGRSINKYCSRPCTSLARKEKKVEKICAQCGLNIFRVPSTLVKVKNTFCSQSCAATYNNTHKTYGTRISKLEVYLQERLTEQYFEMEIHFNRKDTINSELDIYIPSLKLAFELNGILHYEPIYGAEKLAQIQNNDKHKFQACLEKGIELCIINSSELKYFKPSKAEKYLEIIVELINFKMF